MKTIFGKGLMTRLNGIRLALMAALTVAIAAPAASAGGQVPLKASFDTEFESTVVFPTA